MPRADAETRLVDAALRILARKSWADLTLGETAKAAKIPFVELFPIARSKPALFGLMLRRIGRDTAARYKPDAGSGTSRDRIFDVAMTWFECLAPRKPAVRALHHGLKRDPLALVAARSEILSAAEWLLVLSGADAGSALPLRTAALATLLARAIPVWLDDGKDLTKTMACLDGDLRRSERFFGSGQPARESR